MRSMRGRRAEMAAGASDYARWMASPEGARATLQKYRHPIQGESGEQMESSPEPTSQQVKLIQAFNQVLWVETQNPPK
jgi:hypothetical protein